MGQNQNQAPLPPPGGLRAPHPVSPPVAPPSEGLGPAAPRPAHAGRLGPSVPSGGDAPPVTMGTSVLGALGGAGGAGTPRPPEAAPQRGGLATRVCRFGVEGDEAWRRRSQATPHSSARGASNPGSVRGRRCRSPRAPRADSDRPEGGRVRLGGVREDSPWPSPGACITEHSVGGSPARHPTAPQSWGTGEGRCPPATGAGGPRRSPGGHPRGQRASIGDPRGPLPGCLRPASRGAQRGLTPSRPV